MARPTLVLMTPPPPRLLAAAVLFVVLVAAAAFFDAPRLMPWLSLVVSLLALALAVLAVFKTRMLQFCPEVFAGDVILAPGGRLPRARLLLPLQFSNAGYADGLVEWVALRLVRDGKTERATLLSPVAEVDMRRFLEARRRITEDNALEPFTSFVLEGKQTLAKFVLFDVSERARAEPLELAPGRYSFELFIKTSHSPRPHLERSFEHVLEAAQLEEYANDNAVYLINYQVTLPAVRRTLAPSEWLPRGEGRAASAG